MSRCLKSSERARHALLQRVPLSHGSCDLESSRAMGLHMTQLRFCRSGSARMSWKRIDTSCSRKLSQAVGLSDGQPMPHLQSSHIRFKRLGHVQAPVGAAARRSTAQGAFAASLSQLPNDVGNAYANVRLKGPAPPNRRKRGPARALPPRLLGGQAFCPPACLSPRLTRSPQCCAACLCYVFCVLGGPLVFPGRLSS